MTATQPQPIYVDTLLELAHDLAGANAGRGRPRPIALRRAVSSAYYALFHELTAASSRRLMGAPATDAHHLVRRWYDHGEMRKVCEAYVALGKGRTPPKPIHELVQLDGNLSPKLVSIAEDFVSLQDARHRADYDHTARLDKSAALGDIRRAAQAVAAARELEKAADRHFQTFTFLLLTGKTAKR